MKHLEPIKIKLKFIKSTKNKHVYGMDGSAIPSVYIEKTALSDPPPEFLETEMKPC